MTPFSKITEYFMGSVMPLLRSEYGDILPRLSIMILGSVGLGIDDELSDVEAGLYLDDVDWKQYGSEIQLSLNELLRKNNPWQQAGSIFCIHPISWLLDGQANIILAKQVDFPWDALSIETLFTVQNNLIIFDPQGVLQKLRDKTAPSERPDALWRKSLLVELKSLIGNLSDFKDCVMRENHIEANIFWGLILECLLRVGFIASRCYYPWRTHLGWAFNRLPLPYDIISLIDKVMASEDWRDKLESANQATAAYLEFILANKLLPGIDLTAPSLQDELLWAERLSAWDHPNWRDRITNCTKKAVASGYPEKDFWVWSLWNKQN